MMFKNFSLQKFWNVKQNGSCITSVMGGGLGDQGISTLAAIALAREMGIEYRHSPFAHLSHCPDANTEEYTDKWERFLNLGHGARLSKFARGEKFKVVFLLLKHNAETRNIPSLERLKTRAGWNRVNLKRAEVVPMQEFVAHLNGQDRTDDKVLYIVCAGLNQPHRMQTLGDTLNSVRLNYQHSAEEKAELLLPGSDFLNIAVHLRGGDKVFSHPRNIKNTRVRVMAERFLEISRAMPKLMKNLSRTLDEMQLPHRVSVYVEENADFVEEILEGLGMEYNLRIGESPFADFHQMVSADILIHNKSTFSTFAGHLSENIKLSTEDGIRLPGWMIWNIEDGGFDAEELKKLIHGHRSHHHGIKYAQSGQARINSDSMQKPSAQDTLAAYQRINSGYRRKAVFQLSHGMGFGSNFNQVIKVILYCLVHKLQFQLGSDFYLSDKKEESGMFAPFCLESKFQPPHITQDKDMYRLGYTLRWKTCHPFVVNLNFAVMNTRFPNMPGDFRRLIDWLEWLFMALRFFWLRGKNIRRKKFLNHHFLFPQLGIDGDVFHARSVITKVIFQSSAKISDEHRAAVESLKPYIAVHVRRGDKITCGEAKRIEVPEYLEKIQSLEPGIRNIFIATDDYRVVPEFRKLRSDLNIVTLCDKEKKGYSQKEFRENFDVEEEWAEFLVDLYYLENADHFVGTYSSNVGRLVALLRGPETCHSLDYEWGLR